MSAINRAEYDQQNLRVPQESQQYKQEDIDDSEVEESPKEKRTGRRKIKIEYIDDKSRRHITFSKRKAGIMKKAYELSTLTGTQVLLLVASETGHVYTFATTKLQPLITKTEGKTLIQSCLNAPDVATDDMNYPQGSAATAASNTGSASTQSSPIYNPSPAAAAASTIPSPQSNIVKNNAVQESSPQSMPSQKITLQSQIYNESSPQVAAQKPTPAQNVNPEQAHEIFNDERKIFQQPSYNGTTTPTMPYNSLSTLQNPNFSPQSYQQTPQQQPTTPNNQLTSNGIPVNSPYMYQYSSTNVQTAGYQSAYGNMVGSATGYFTPTSVSSPQAGPQNQLPQANSLIMSSLRQQPTPPQYPNSSSQSHPPATQRTQRRVHPYQRSPSNQTAPPTPQSSH